MRCVTKTSLFVLTVFLIVFSIQTVESSKIYHVTSSSQHFATGQGYINFADSITPLIFTTFYKQGSTSKLYVNSTWIKTTSDLTVNAFFSSEWFNYTTSEGTQQLYYTSKPNVVYFDDVSKNEGDGWTYSDNTVTVTPSGTDVAITWGEVGNGDEDSNNGSAGGPDTPSGGVTVVGPFAKFRSMLIIIGLTVMCLVLLWLGETTKRRR